MSFLCVEHAFLLTFLLYVQEFVLFMVKHPIQEAQKADKKIDIKPHAPYGSKQVMIIQCLKG